MDDSRSCDRSLAQALRGATGGGGGGGGRGGAFAEGSSSPPPPLFLLPAPHTYIHILSADGLVALTLDLRIWIRVSCHITLSIIVRGV